MIIKKILGEKRDKAVVNWMGKNGISLLRISVGIVFLWFGFLKFFPSVSPAEKIAVDTIKIISFDLLSSKAILIILATWETLIGIGLIAKIYLREILVLLFLQMIGTITPLFFFPEEVFNVIPYAPTLEGQYIIKNIVLISAAIVIGATIRGGNIETENKE
ncbi:MAG: hypothetical protein ACLFUW_05500 [Bacteroidales bacterium]